MSGWYWRNISTTRSARASTVSSRNVSSATKIGTILQPRFIIIHAATGESMPPETSATSVPSTPSGRPPTPFITVSYR